MIDFILIAFASLIVGGAGGYFTVKHLQSKQQKQKLSSKMLEIERKIAIAQKNLISLEKEADKKEREAEKTAQKLIITAQKEIDTKERYLEKELARLEEREKSLHSRGEDIDRQKKRIETLKEELKEKKDELEQMIESEVKKLEEISGLTANEAKDRLISLVEKNSEQDLVHKIRRMEDRMKIEVDEKARSIIVQSIQKLASDVTSESTISHVELDEDDMKGRIIGKEGRNINAFERVTGVNLIIDDTPNIVILSSFDPLRRHLAAEVLKELLSDGRVHPARIEEVMRQKQVEVDKMIQKLGEDAVFETGVTGLHPDIIKILGRLHFRTSYGQNVLRHSIECAFVAEAIANLVGANTELAKKASLLHDLGKTLSHEVGGKHALLSGEIARKFQLDDDLVHAIEAHHEDIPIQTVEGYIVQAADAISASRPGARRETNEKFIKRMIDLEGIATSYKGVNRCFAMSAGREIWIFVDPEHISDLDASRLSWDITRRIESDLQYPGEIKVVMIRENRYTHTAS